MGSEQMGQAQGDFIGDLTGSNRAADAAGRAAMAREKALAQGVQFGKEGLGRAQANEAAVGGDINNALAAAQSPQELQALTASLQNQERAVQRQSDLFASIDPAVMEASKQALQLLQGEEAKSQGPLKKQRATQRQQLVDRLREQLGPGAETSTAGIQALNAFDQESGQLFSGAQQQGLSQLFGIAQSGAQGRSAMNQGNLALGQIGQAFGGRAGRLSQANFGAAGARTNAAGLTQGATGQLIGAQTGLAGGAGSANVASQLRGQAQNQFNMDMIQMGAEMNSSAMGAGGEMGGKALGAGGACCFIFLEARYGTGTMDEVVRMFRDEHITLRNQRGYYKLSEVLVPLMRKSRVVKGLVRLLMTDPLVSYGKYYYGEGKVGKLFTPVKNFWLKVFNYLGQDHEFIRENGETL